MNKKGKGGKGSRKKFLDAEEDREVWTSGNCSVLVGSFLIFGLR
jgi:hypothetical protein